MDFRGDISGSAWIQSKVSLALEETIGLSYTLILKTFYNCKCSRIVNILHDKPVNCLLVLAIYPGGFY